MLKKAVDIRAAIANKMHSCVAVLVPVLLVLSMQHITVNAAVQADLVGSLPGFDGPLLSRMWSGFMPTGNDTQKGKTYEMFEHYIFIEAEEKPEKKPVVLWTNGGPGAASLFGLFVELGPYYLSLASLETESYNKTGIPSLFVNPYRWTKLANLLIINSPPPVGFSYCKPVGPAGDGNSCGDWDDERTAKHNRMFIEYFRTQFPEYSKNEFYITGESYAGIYVPTMVQEILRNSRDLSLLRALKGFAVGDACTGKEVNCGSGDVYFNVEFLHGHGQFSDLLYREIQRDCSVEELRGDAHRRSKGCNKLLEKMKQQVGGYYAYSLYDECFYENDILTYGGTYGGALNDYPCGGYRVMNTWLQSDIVRSKLNVPKGAFFFSGDNGAGFNYRPTVKNLLPFYKHVIEHTPLRVLVYNGDTDPSVNSLQAENWTSALRIEVEHEWRPWTTDGKQAMAGYVTEYKHDFSYLTIRGSGHMVPEYKGKATLSFLGAWLSNKKVLPYVSPPRRNKQVQSLVD